MHLPAMPQAAALPGGRTFYYYPLSSLQGAGLGDLNRLPFSIKVLLESVLRRQGRPGFEPGHVQTLAGWTPCDPRRVEIPFLPARVLLQDFTGVPCVVDLAALRGAMQRAGRDPRAIEPQIPVDLVIDHSVQVDETASAGALEANMRLEFERNIERYEFLRWGQSAFHKLRIVPPGLGICHQVNLEYLAQVVATETDSKGRLIAFPDTLVGTDSHTTMINGAGVLGWGVGGIEAEAAMLGQPIPVLTPVVTGVRLTGRLGPGVSATDLALTLTQLLRTHGVVEQFVEYFGPGLDHLPLADRATVANMSPEYGATMGFFPVDAETIRYLHETGRSAEQIELVETYCRLQGLFRQPGEPDPVFSRVIELDLGTVEAALAGPKRPHDRVPLGEVKARFRQALQAPVKEQGYGVDEATLARPVPAEDLGTLGHGAVVVASITSCTNTSNPQVMLAAGLLARQAVERGLKPPPYVKTTLAPGSRVVTAYLQRTGLLTAFEKLGFHVAAYGCATCIGNSGPLDPRVSRALKDGGLVAAAVLSGNRNFEGRVHPLTKANYLASPLLVVAYALAGRVDLDLTTEPLGRDGQGRPVFLKDLWPEPQEVARLAEAAADPELYRTLYKNIAQSNPVWNKLAIRQEPVFMWNEASTYIREPSFISDIPDHPAPLADLAGARGLALFGDFITTDHISPAGSIPPDSPAGRYLQEHGVPPASFNSYGARRGNHEVMVRGTFANIRIRNRLVDREGGWTRHFPDGGLRTIYDAAMQYARTNTPLVVLAGKLYGAGSSRDWAAKGTKMLGVRAVIAESFERIHRSNLVEMGVLPLEFAEGQTAETLGLTGQEEFSISGLGNALAPGGRLDVAARAPDGRITSFRVKCRIDSEIELDYYRQGGILPFVLRQALGR